MTSSVKIPLSRPSPATSRADALAQSLFHGIRPSLSMWAMWVIAGQWVLAVAIVIWGIAKWGWTIDHPGEWGYAALFVAVVHGAYVTPMTNDCILRRAKGAVRLWRMMAYPLFLPACLTICLAMAAPFPKEPWASVAPNRHRTNMSLVVLMLLAVSLAVVMLIVGRLFPWRRPGDDRGLPTNVEEQP